MLKRTVSLRASDGSFEFPQHMFWLRNKKINFGNTLLSGGLLVNAKGMWSAVAQLVELEAFLFQDVLESPVSPGR